VAWAVVHPVVVYIPFNIRFFRRLDISLSMYLRALWPAISGCLVMAVAVTVFRELMPSSIGRGLHAGLEVLAGAMTYFLCLLLMHRSRIVKLRTLWQQRTA
jgi:hypothetical protein